MDQNEIAMLARDIWYKEGCQNGRDLEYWLRAEQFLTLSLQGNGQHLDNVPAERKVTSSSGKSQASELVRMADPGASNSRKRKSAR